MEGGSLLWVDRQASKVLDSQGVSNFEQPDCGQISYTLSLSVSQQVCLSDICCRRPAVKNTNAL